MRILAPLLLALLVATPIGAQTPFPERPVIKLYRSPLPNWKVGDIDRDLSRLCSLGQFNQRVPFRFVGQFVGPSGAAMLGGAKGTGLNLFDPLNRSDPGFDYWFHRDRTSACIVYRAEVDKTGTPLEGQGVVPR